MSAWMTTIDRAVAEWARAGARRDLVVKVEAAVMRAWSMGAPTAEAIQYARRRVAHYAGGRR